MKLKGNDARLIAAVVENDVAVVKALLLIGVSASAIAEANRVASAMYPGVYPVAWTIHVAHEGGVEEERALVRAALERS